LKALLRYDGIDPSFDDDALTLIAEKAKAEGTGARGLRKIIEDILLDIRFDSPGSGVKEVRITREFIEGDRQISSLRHGSAPQLSYPGMNTFS
jgi:ATP-dependent Clp protease ATP-binding subunit ClpX